MINRGSIINAYVRIREIDNTIPDEVLDYMKNAALESLVRDGELSNVMILPSPNDKKRERVAFLKGVLSHSIWADYIPNGNERCDAYEKELAELTGES